MESAEVHRLLSEAISKIGSALNQSTWYLFGSHARGAADARDIDLLIVTESVEQGMALRAALFNMSVPEPLHLITMTRAEEHELAFKENAKAVQIYP